MNESELILNCQKGDKQAFQSLISLYYPYVAKFLHKLTADESLSEDLTQEVFLKVIRNIEKFDIYGKATFATYVLTIAKNLYIDHLRKDRHLRDSWNEQDLISSVNVEELIIKNMQAKEIMEMLEALPPEQAEAIKLKYLEQLTLNEIAERFACEPKTIKSRIHNGTVKLRQKLGRGGNDDG